MNECKRVLIVDHDDLVLIELERILEDAGFDTTTTWDIGEAVRLLSQRSYDFILMGDCFCGAEAEQLLQRTNTIGDAPRCVTLSWRSIRVDDRLATGRLRTVCKRCPDDVLRAINLDRTRALSQVA